MKSHLMSNLKTALRALLLILLLGLGLWMMDQIAQSTLAGRSRGSPSKPASDPATPTTSQSPSAPASAVPLDSARPDGSNSGVPPSVDVAGNTPPGKEPADQTTEPLAKESLAAKPSPSPGRTDVGEAPALRILRGSEGQYIATEPILFNTASSEIRLVSVQPLRKVAALLRERPDINLMIVGYTDNLGLPANNQRVSGERAAAVRSFLVGEGIDQSRLESRGMGSQNPIASNDTQLGRQANRRIEFIITSPK